MLASRGVSSTLNSSTICRPWPIPAARMVSFTPSCSTARCLRSRWVSPWAKKSCATRSVSVILCPNPARILKGARYECPERNDSRCAQVVESPQPFARSPDSLGRDSPGAPAPLEFRPGWGDRLTRRGELREPPRCVSRPSPRAFRGRHLHRFSCSDARGLRQFPSECPHRILASPRPQRSANCRGDCRGGGPILRDHQLRCVGLRHDLSKNVCGIGHVLPSGHSVLWEHAG